jgi:hypothetical protein
MVREKFCSGCGNARSRDPYGPQPALSDGGEEAELDLTIESLSAEELVKRMKDG